MTDSRQSANSHRPDAERATAEGESVLTGNRDSEGTRTGAAQPKIGCGYLVWWLLWACLLIVMNSLFFTSFYDWAAAKGPRYLRQPRIAQAFMFIGPIVLMLVQFWIKDLLWPLRKKSNESNS